MPLHENYWLKPWIVFFFLSWNALKESSLPKIKQSVKNINIFSIYFSCQYEKLKVEIFMQIWLKDSIFLSISLLKEIVANHMEIYMLLATKLATRNMEIYMLLVATKLLKRNMQMSMFLAKGPLTGTWN